MLIMCNRKKSFVTISLQSKGSHKKNNILTHFSQFTCQEELDFLSTTLLSNININMDSPSSKANNTEITLKGSVKIVSEFFFYAINSILYQRGIYMPETFKRESKYGLTVLTTSDEGLIHYLNQVIHQVESWLNSGHVQRLVVVVSGVDSGETLERWQFNVTLQNENGFEGGENRNPNVTMGTATKNNTGKKSLKEINNEIQAIIRQITASVTFLPLLNEPCTFDLLVYTDKEASIPIKWAESDPCYIMNSQQVKLRSFTTSVHKVDSMVSYREVDEWEI